MCTPHTEFYMLVAGVLMLVIFGIVIQSVIYVYRPRYPFMAPVVGGRSTTPPEFKPAFAPLDTTATINGSLSTDSVDLMNKYRVGRLDRLKDGDRFIGLFNNGQCGRCRVVIDTCSLPMVLDTLSVYTEPMFEGVLLLGVYRGKVFI